MSWRLRERAPAWLAEVRAVRCDLDTAARRAGARTAARRGLEGDLALADLGALERVALTGRHSNHFARLRHLA